MRPMSPDEHIFIQRLDRDGEEQVRDDLLHDRYSPKYRVLAQQWLETRSTKSATHVRNLGLVIAVISLLIAASTFVYKVME